MASSTRSREHEERRRARRRTRTEARRAERRERTLARRAQRRDRSHPRGGRWRRLAAALAALALVVGSVSVATSQPASSSDVTITDDETVYVIMDANGDVQDTVVVDWLKIIGSGEVTVVDKGEVDGVESLKEELEPEISNGNIAWTVEVDERRDVFYRTETSKPTPIEVSATYTLDGAEVDPAALAGETGRLGIEVTVVNTDRHEETLEFEAADGSIETSTAEYWTPFLVVIQMTFDGLKVTNVESEDTGQPTVTGSDMAYNFITFPQPDETVSIEMDMTDIALDPMIVSAVPQKVSDQVPDVDIADQLGDLKEGIDGLSQLSGGHVAILDGLLSDFDTSQLDDLAAQMEEFDQLVGGVTQLSDGADGLVLLVDGQIMYLDELIAELESADYSELNELPAAVEELAAGVHQSKDGLDELIALLDQQILLLQGLQASNSAASALAGSVAASYPADPDVQTLHGMLVAQDSMLVTLTAGGLVEVAPGVTQPVPGIATTRDGLADLSAGLGEIAAGLDQLAEESKALEEIPAEFEQLVAALKVLRDGGEIEGQQLPGLVETKSGIEGIALGLNELESGLAGSADQFADVEQLPAQLELLRSTLVALRDGGTLMGQYVPGIKTTESALKELADGMAEGIDEAAAGEALVETLDAAAEAYDSFLGKPEGAEGRVRFIMQLEGVQTEED
jgi:putative membrane protein